MGYIRDIVSLSVNNIETAHRVIPMPTDGSCLFHSIAYSIFKYIDKKRTSRIRAEIVEYVCENWEELNAWTVNRQGDPFESVDIYRREMLNYYTFGSVCELKAAGSLYKLRIEIYRHGKLEGLFGEEDGPVKRFRFKGELISGHYDVCQTLDEPFNETELYKNFVEFRTTKINDYDYPEGNSLSAKARRSINKKRRQLSKSSIPDDTDDYQSTVPRMTTLGDYLDSNWVSTEVRRNNFQKKTPLV